MPESALTEKAGITPDGNVLVANARVTIGVDVTGIAGRMAGQLPLLHPWTSRPEDLGSHGKDGKGSFPTRGVIIDAHRHVDDDPMLSGCPDTHSSTELLVGRDKSALIDGGQ
jgi:hypothetical protein